MNGNKAGRIKNLKVISMFVEEMRYPVYNMITLKVKFDVLRKVFISHRFDISWNIKINDKRIEVLHIDTAQGCVILLLDNDDEDIHYPVKIDFQVTLTHVLESFGNFINVRYGEMEIIQETWISEKGPILKNIESNFDQSLRQSILQPQFRSRQEIEEELRRKALEDSDNKNDEIIDVDFIEINDKQLGGN